jgi:arylsulfatase A-like enzyme
MPDRPNVLWVCTDQQRWDTLGCYGNDLVETPRLDALADRGVQFERAYCQSTVCTPSRASMLTGRYPRTTGCRANGRPMPEDERLVTHDLADAGYHCGLAGKLHLSPYRPYADESPTIREPIRRLDDGYAEFHWSSSPTNDGQRNEYKQWLRERGVEYRRERLDVEHASIGMPAEHHQTTWCAEKAINCIEAHESADDPWLFSVNMFDPHPAFRAPEGYLDRYMDRLDEVPPPNYEPGELDDKPAAQHEQHTDGNPAYTDLDDRGHRVMRATYYAMVDLIDEQVGRLLDALDRTGQRDETLVVFTSDHGELCGDHGMYTKGPFFYEPSVRVPLLVDGPGVASGRTVDDLVGLIDLAPTLLDTAGLDRPPGMQGRSLWPALDPDGADPIGRDAIYCEGYACAHVHDVNSTMVRTDRYKLVRHHDPGDGELYDLHEDPDETHNRWDDPEYAGAKRELLVALSDRMAATVDPLPERAGPW